MRPRTIPSLLALLLLVTHAWTQGVMHAHVVAVSDGDTIKILTADKTLMRIRLSWIDAPELGQAFGRRAKQVMRTLVFGKDVELHPHADR